MITKIKYRKQKILGDLELDFKKDDGKPYKTIILAGENGTGKSTILRTLHSSINSGILGQFEHFEFIANNEEYMLVPQKTKGPYEILRKFDDSIQSFNFLAGKHITIEPDNFSDIRNMGCVFSKAKSWIDSDTDTGKKNRSNKETAYDAASLKQELIDLSSQDDNEWLEISKQNDPISYREFQTSCRIYRFSKVFNSFFDDLEFHGVEQPNSLGKQVMFKKNNNKISIDSLSTGEKQIVFRAIHLLKSLTIKSRGIVLIDEPELSMHPKWQLKILQFYRDLCTISKVQNSQLIIATHSEYVLRTALENISDVLVIVLSQENDSIRAKRILQPYVLPTITTAETNFLAFGIYSTDYHIALYGYLQSKHGLNSVKNADNYISKSPFYNKNDHSYASSFGKTKYTTLPTFIRNTIDHPDNGLVYTFEQLKISTDFLIKLCK